MSNKIEFPALVVFLCVCLVFTSYTDFDKKQIFVTSSSVSFGVRVGNDRLVMRKDSAHRFRWFQRVERYVKFMGSTNLTVITGMRFRSQANWGSATVTILDGGLHHRHVLLHILSQWNRGFNICVNIFAFRNRKRRLTVTQKRMMGRRRKRHRKQS